MPDIGTIFGSGQAVGLGFGLLIFLGVRAWRYRTDVSKSFIPIWLACCVGLAIYSIVDVGVDGMTVAVQMPVIVALPCIAALVLRRFMMRPSA